MSKAAADRSQRQLLELAKQPGNNQCADCKSPTPRWASWDQGVFLCVQCASMHRKIGSHITKIKSLTLDTWSKDQVDNMRKLGNVKVNSLLNPDERRNPPPPPNSDDSRNSELERFVRNKYEYRTFQAYPSPVSTPQPQLQPTLTSHQPPPIRSPPSTFSPPPLPSRQSSFAQSAFASSSATSPPPLPTRQPTLPTSQTQIRSQPPPNTTTSRKLAKSVRFPSSPPTRIPSPPDSEDDEDSYSPPPKRRAIGNAPKSILVTKGHEIPIDWALLTKEPSWGDGDDDDVPLQALGALGMRGANVGLVGVPKENGMGFTPTAMYGANQQGGGRGGLQPLMPQFTGSAKGYLHEQHAGIIQGGRQGGMMGQMIPQMLKPQMTGSVGKNYGVGGAGGGMDGDSFSRMFQPPSTTTTNQTNQTNFNGFNSGGMGGMGTQQTGGGGYGMMGNGNLSNGNQSNPSSQGFQQFAPAPAPQQPLRTNPFTQFAQPQQQSRPPPNQNQNLQPPAQPQPFASIWDDLTSLSPSSTPIPTPQQQTPQPLRPQLTGFTPSSSFGQQLLAREASPVPTPSQPPPNSSQFVDRSSSPFVAPQPLKPQYTGYVPSSTLNLQGGPTPQSLKPQVTGFVPSSSFGQSLLQHTDFNPNPTSSSRDSNSSPAPFDSSPSLSHSHSHSQQKNPTQSDLFDFDLFPSTSSSSNSHPSNRNQELQPPQPQFAQSQQRSSSPSSNPFMTMPNSFASALPPLPQQYGAGGGNTNPFFNQPQLQSQNTGYYPSQQQQQQLPLRQQVTGFGGTNPFMMQQGGGGGGGMFGNGNGSGYR